MEHEDIILQRMHNRFLGLVCFVIPMISFCLPMTWVTWAFWVLILALILLCVLVKLQLNTLTELYANNNWTLPEDLVLSKTQRIVQELFVN